MATILIETKLDVIEKQRKLVEEALVPDSIYIRMKYTCGYIHILLIYICVCILSKQAKYCSG